MGGKNLGLPELPKWNLDIHFPSLLINTIIAKTTFVIPESVHE